MEVDLNDEVSPRALEGPAPPEELPAAPEEPPAPTTGGRLSPIFERAPPPVIIDVEAIYLGPDTRSQRAKRAKRARLARDPVVVSSDDSE